MAMVNARISENAVPIAVEDKFLIFSFGRGDLLCPHSAHAEQLGEMVLNLRAPFDKLTPIFDLRGTEGYYNDVDTFIQFVGGKDALVLLGDSEIEAGWDFRLRLRGLQPIRANGLAFSTTELGLEKFEAEAEMYKEDVISGLAGKIQSWEHYQNILYGRQLEDFTSFLQSIQRNSLLVEYVMSYSQGGIEVTPYHTSAVHNVETSPSSVVIGRPGVIARTTRAVFASQIDEFQQLINKQETKERDLQSFLERNPDFLRGLNYQNVYSQLVLERGNDGSLVPDFILEPYEDGFCDILDLKLPTQNIIVGGKDRATLAAGLHAVAAQLREYTAYFEQEKHQRFVKEKYGLRFYRPRMIAIVGRDMKQMTESQIRRAMTVYPDLQFMTFDELLKHAQNRMLI